MKILNISVLGLYLFVVIVFVCLPSPVPLQGQDAQQQFIDGLSKTGSKAGYPDTEFADNAFDNKLATRIGLIIKIVLSFLGVIFLVLMVYGGFTWMTAHGNEQQIAKARGIIFNAMIGLVVVLAAYAITAYFGGELAKVVTG